MAEIVHIPHETRVSCDLVTCRACTWYRVGDDESALAELGREHAQQHRGRTEPWEVFDG